MRPEERLRLIVSMTDVITKSAQTVSKMQILGPMPGGIFEILENLSRE